jgi:hypothetical protein
LVAQDSQEKGITLPVARQRDPGGGDAEGKLTGILADERTPVRPGYLNKLSKPLENSAKRELLLRSLLVRGIESFYSA